MVLVWGMVRFVTFGSLFELISTLFFGELDVSVTSSSEKITEPKWINGPDSDGSYLGK